MRILASHPTGNANVRAVVEAFERHGILSEFNTSISTDPSATWLKFLPASVRNELLRRKFPIEQKLIRSFPLKEIGRLGFPKIGLKKMTQHELGPFSVDAMYQYFDKKVSKRISSIKKNTGLSAIYAYEDGALMSFKKAKELGVSCFYDLPIGYWRCARTLLKAEISSNPDWASTLTGFKDSQEKLNRKDEELKYADRIFVASSFTKKTLEEFPGDIPEIEVIPYGFPKVDKPKKYQNIDGRKLKILFVGGLSQRKGISYLFDAVEGMKEQVELTIVGKKAIENCKALNRNLEKHSWIPSMPHHEILACMREHDVFVFPSLFEGFGMVITEAMSQGVPVITTDRTAGPDLINHGENGWLVDSASAKSIQDVLRILIDSPELIERVGRAAQITAEKRPWSVYGDELVRAILTGNKY